MEEVTPLTELLPSLDPEDTNVTYLQEDQKTGNPLLQLQLMDLHGLTKETLLDQLTKNLATLLI